LKNPSKLEAEAAKPVKVVRGRADLRTNLLRVFSLAIVVTVIVAGFNFREHIRALSTLGYPGVFLISLLSSATMFLPAPGVAIVFAMGSVLVPWAVALVAGTGAAIGETTGWLAGFSGQGVIERADVYARVAPLVSRFGGWAILVFAAIPNPFFDVAGVAAGASGMPLWRFFVFCWAGEIIKMGIFALAGAYSITWVTGLFR